MVSIFYPPHAFGGDAVYLQRLCQALTRQGHEVEVAHCLDSYRTVSSFRQGGAEAAPREFPASPGITIHALESGLPAALTTLLSHQLGRPVGREDRLREIFRSKPFDVIHFHNVSLLGPRVLELPARPGALKLYTAHEYWLTCPLSVMWKYGQRACEAPSCTRCTLRAARPPQWWRAGSMLDRASRAVDLFLTPSEFAARLHRQRGFARPMAVLPLFAEQPEVSEASRPSPHPRPYVLFVGRLEAYKGVEDLLEIFAGDGDGKLAGCDLLIAGAGDHEPALRRKAQGCRRVHWLGWISPSDLGVYYRHARAVAAPSRTYETFGMVALEAMARGVPVVARRIGALAEIVAASRGGRLFEDPAELERSLQTIVSDPAERASLSAAGRAFYQANWTPQEHLERYFELIAQARNR